MSTITLSHTHALALAKQYRAASAALREFRREHAARLSEDDLDTLKLTGTALREAAVDMTTEAVAIVIDESQSGLGALGAVTEDATAVLEKIDDIKQAMGVAAALLGLAAALPTGKPGEVHEAFQKLRALVKPKAREKPVAAKQPA